MKLIEFKVKNDKRTFGVMDIDWKTTSLLWRFWGKRYPHAGWDRAKPFGELSLKKAKKQYGGE